MPTKFEPVTIPARTLYPELSAARITIFAEGDEVPSVEVFFQRIDRDEHGAAVNIGRMEMDRLLSFTLPEFARLVPEMAHLPSDIAKGIALMRQRVTDELAAKRAAEAAAALPVAGSLLGAPAATTTVVADDTAAKDTP